MREPQSQFSVVVCTFLLLRDGDRRAAFYADGLVHFQSHRPPFAFYAAARFLLTPSDEICTAPSLR